MKFVNNTVTIIERAYDFAMLENRQYDIRESIKTYALAIGKDEFSKGIKEAYEFYNAVLAASNISSDEISLIDMIEMFEYYLR